MVPMMMTFREARAVSRKRSDAGKVYNAAFQESWIKVTPSAMGCGLRRQ